MTRTYYVYLLTNWNNKVIYLGVTNNLERRLYEHKNKLVKGFTEKYNVNRLVYFEETQDVTAAIAREKRNKEMAKREEESAGEPDEPKLERSEFWMVKISPFGRNDMTASIMTQERNPLHLLHP